MLFPFKLQEVDPTISSDSFKHLITSIEEHPSSMHAAINIFCNLCFKRKAETPQMRKRSGLIFCNACGLRMSRLSDDQFLEVKFFNSQLLSSFIIDENEYKITGDDLYCPTTSRYWKIIMRQLYSITAISDKNQERIKLNFDPHSYKLNVITNSQSKIADSFKLDANLLAQFYISHRGALLSTADIHSLHLLESELKPFTKIDSAVSTVLKTQLNASNNLTKDVRYICRGIRVWVDNIPLLENDKIDIHCTANVFFTWNGEDAYTIHQIHLQNINLPTATNITQSEVFLERVDEQNEVLFVQLSKAEIQKIYTGLNKLKTLDSDYGNIIEKFKQLLE